MPAHTALPPNANFDMSDWSLRVSGLFTSVDLASIPKKNYVNTSSTTYTPAVQRVVTAVHVLQPATFYTMS